MVTLKSSSDIERPFDVVSGFSIIKLPFGVYIVHCLVKLACHSFVGCLEIDVVNVSLTWAYG